jgi:hypothetical protein
MASFGKLFIFTMCGIFCPGGYKMSHSKWLAQGDKRGDPWREMESTMSRSNPIPLTTTPRHPSVWQSYRKPTQNTSNRTDPTQTNNGMVYLFHIHPLATSGDLLRKYPPAPLTISFCQLPLLSELRFGCSSNWLFLNFWETHSQTGEVWTLMHLALMFEHPRNMAAAVPALNVATGVKSYWDTF